MYAPTSSASPISAYCPHCPQHSATTKQQNDRPGNDSYGRKFLGAHYESKVVQLDHLLRTLSAASEQTQSSFCLRYTNDTVKLHGNPRAVVRLSIGSAVRASAGRIRS